MDERGRALDGSEIASIPPNSPARFVSSSGPAAEHGPAHHLGLQAHGFLVANTVLVERQRVQALGTATADAVMSIALCSPATFSILNPATAP